MTEVKTGQVSQISDVMSDKMEAKVPILSAKDAQTFMSSLVFGAMPHGQCKCAWISTSYVVGVQSGGNTITEWARFAAPVVTGLMGKGGWGPNGACAHTPRIEFTHSIIKALWRPA